MFLGQSHDGRVCHTQSSGKRRICFHQNAVLLAERRNVRSCVEGVHFNLIHRRQDPRFRGDELFEMLDSEL